DKGRAGFVMSSQASSAGGGEAKVRRKLVETGDVDVMVAIRSNFFYTRSVPCELWFLNRDRHETHRDKVLMIDARNIYRKVTRKIYDFSPEQQQNLLAIVWLYRGQTEMYLDLVSGYCRRTLDEGAGCFNTGDESGEAIQPLPDFAAALDVLTDTLQPFINTLADDSAHSEVQKELAEALPAFHADVEAFQQALTEQEAAWKQQKTTNGDLKLAVDRLASLAESSRDLVKQTDLLYKLASRLIETCEKECDAKQSDAWVGRDVTRASKACDEARQLAVEQLKQPRYFWRQAHWLTERFSDAELCDVEGLVKLVDRTEIAANDWSLTPGRYVGVAPEEVDEDFDFEETLREIHVELEDLNNEAVMLAATIKKNFEELGV
ncbi:MAG: N-6 DNA methylase, partial [Pseudomonadota bacterium]|nr:N-6 DNA methylase [Pseudomonadota bacterium]